MLYHHTVVIKNGAALHKMFSVGLLVHDVKILEGGGKRLFNVHSFIFVRSSDRLMYHTFTFPWT
jgi:hypothetical protein